MYRDDRLANSPRWYTKPPKDWHMRVPDSITECVGFLGVPTNLNAPDPEIAVCGTAFFVAVKSARTHLRKYEYLVTAQHCLDSVGARPLYLRLNAFTDTAARVARDIRIQDADEWFTLPTPEQPDPTTPRVREDVAVLPWSDAHHEDFEYQCLPEDLFLTDEIINQRDEYGKHIGIGDEVFITGLFTRVTGRRMNLPILRTGNIAMMPDELVPVRRDDRVDEDMEAYLVEARSTGGLSGSPVFVRYSMEVGTSRKIYLLGLMHGHWDTPPDSIRDVATDAATTALDEMEEAEKVNMGIGIVVPAKKIRQALYLQELVRDRAKRDREAERKSLPTPD